MHNLHLIVCSADSAQEACDFVEDLIDDWGTENNWKTICGCVSENNEVYDVDIIDEKLKGRYCPTDTGFVSIPLINKFLDEVVNSNQYDDIIEKLKTETDLTKWEKLDLFCLGKYVRKVFEKPIDIDVFKINYYQYEYDEVGITNWILDNETTRSQTKYVVFLDMHS